MDSALEADLVHRSRLPRGRQGRQPAQRVSRSEILGKPSAVFFQRRARRFDSAPRAGSFCRRVRSRFRRRRRAQPGVAALWRRAWSTSRRSICGPGTRGRIRYFRRPPTSGTTGRTGRPGTGSPGGSAARRSMRWSARCSTMPASMASIPARLREGCDGYVVDRPMSPRAMIEPLAMAYAFDATAADGTLRFIQRGGAPVAEIAEDDLVLPDSGTVARLTRAQETELPREASFGFTDAVADYRRSAVTSRKLVGRGRPHAAFRSCRDHQRCRGDPARGNLAAGSVGGTRERRVCAGHRRAAAGARRRRRAHLERPAAAVRDRRPHRHRSCAQVKARSIDPEVFSVPLLAPRIKVPAIPAALGPVAVTVLDLPALDSSTPVVLTRLAITANPWPGSVAIWKSSDGASFEIAAVAAAPCAIGETLDDLPAGPTARWDRAQLGARKTVWRRAGLDRRCAGAGRRQRRGGAECRWRVGDFSVRQCRAGRRPDLAAVATAARAGRQRICDGRSVAGGRAVRACSARTWCRSRSGSTRWRGRCNCASWRPGATTTIRRRWR